MAKRIYIKKEFIGHYGRTLAVVRIPVRGDDSDYGVCFNDTDAAIDHGDEIRRHVLPGASVILEGGLI